MIKIGIIGTDGGMDSGHTKAVCKIFAENRDKWDAGIVSLYGDNEAETKAIADEYGINSIEKKPEDMSGTVDGVMVMPRDGNKHLRYAMPFIEKGMPVFMDKPFTSSREDAKAVVEAAEKSGSPICGGSYVKFADEVLELKEIADGRDDILSGYIAFPTQLVSPYGFHFYSHHAIEIMLTIFGRDVREVKTVVVNNRLTAIVKYDKFPVIINYATTYSGLSAGIYLANDGEIMKKISLTDKEAYQCGRFVKMVKTRKGEKLQHYIDVVNISCIMEEEVNKGRM